MFLKAISIRNFRTIEHVDLEFAAGLNILFGPNEAGKSTFLDALHAAFFVNADSSKTDVGKYRPWESQADPSVHVVFSALGREYILEKSYVGAKKGRLTCQATGLDTSNKDRINEELATLIPLYSSDGRSLRNTFWIAQRELESTAAELNKDSNLRSALQRIMFRSDGDLEEIKKNIRKTLTEYKKGLERHAERPGPVALAKKELDRLTGEVTELRSQLDAHERNVSRHRELTERITKLQARIEEDNGVVQAVEKYRQAKKNLEDANRTFDLLEEEIEIYRSGEKRTGEIKNRIAAVQQEKLDLERTLSLIQILEERDALDAKIQEETALLDSVQKVEAQLAALRQQLSAFAPVTKNDLEKSRERLRSIEVKTESLKASQLRVELSALADITIRVSEDETRMRDEPLRKEDSKTFSANQKLRITIPNLLDLKIASGVSNASALQKDLNLEQESISLIFDSHGVNSIEELAGRFDAQQQLASSIEILQTEKNAKLNSRTVQDLEASIAQRTRRVVLISQESGEFLRKATDSKESLQQKLNAGRDEFAHLSAEMNQIEQTAAKFIVRYKSPEQASLQRKELARQAAKAEAAMEEVSKMDLEDDKVFTLKKNLETNRIEFSKNRDELMKISGALQSSAVSSDQLRLREAELVEAQASYESNLLEYDAHRILDESLAEAEAQVATHLMQPIEQMVTPILPRLTDKRYSHISLNERLEIQSVGFKNLSVTPDDLSTGTQGQLALALRLALIGHVSGKERQTVVIDDALVNFDDERLQEGKILLSEFANTHQVVYMSCHPEIRNWAGAKVLTLK